MNKIKEFQRKMQLLKIKVLLKKNRYLHKKQLASGNKSETWCELQNLSKNLKANKLFLQLHQKDESNKEMIFDIIQLMGEYGIDLQVTEFDCIFDNEDIRTILSKNSNTKVDLRYMLKSYFSGDNIETAYDIGLYNQILDKIEYLSKVSKSNFKNKDEQVIFIIDQLADYISFNYDYKDASKEELKEISNLKGALIDKKTVCIGYSMALQRCLTNIGVECDIILGDGSETERKELYPWTGNHAWNQIKLYNDWYNVDVTWFSKSKDIKENGENAVQKYVLVDDNSFERHHATKDYQMHKCDKQYENRIEAYKKVKNIKNVLNAYDLGKRDTILQYDLEDIYLEKEETSKERELDKISDVEMQDH